MISEEILVKLSTTVRRLRISQLSSWEFDYHIPYFFGLFNVDWAPIFIEMFTNKLEKLSIDSCYAKFLSRSSADMLIEVSLIFSAFSRIKFHICLCLKVFFLSCNFDFSACQCSARKCGLKVRADCMEMISLSCRMNTLWMVFYILKSVSKSLQFSSTLP